MSQASAPSVKLVIPAPPDAMRGLQDWAWLLPPRIAPLAVNRFGDWYIATPDGSINLLSIWEGTFAPVAPSENEWAAWLATADGMETNWCELVLLQYDRGQTLADGECFAFNPPPLVGGAGIDIKAIKKMSLAVITSLMGQMFRQLAGAR